MNNPLGVRLVKGIREPHEVKKKSFDLGGNRTHDLLLFTSYGRQIKSLSKLFAVFLTS